MCDAPTFFLFLYGDTPINWNARYFLKKMSIFFIILIWSRIIPAYIIVNVFYIFNIIK
jgi:hypothetical protein